MSEAERKAKDAERNKHNRAAMKAKLASAAAVEGAVQAPSFDAALEQAATAAALGNVEKDDFCDWLLDIYYSYFLAHFTITIIMSRPPPGCVPVIVKNQDLFSNAAFISGGWLERNGCSAGL